MYSSEVNKYLKTLSFRGLCPMGPSRGVDNGGMRGMACTIIPRFWGMIFAYLISHNDDNDSNNNNDNNYNINNNNNYDDDNNNPHHYCNCVYCY